MYFIDITDKTIWVNDGRFPVCNCLYLCTRSIGVLYVPVCVDA